MNAETRPIPASASPQQARFRQYLQDYFGALDAAVLDGIHTHCEWIECEGGATLFSQGDPGDAAYFLISGRLRAIRTTSDGGREALGDIKPGETVGELAVLSDAVRGATVIAMRDSVVVRIATDHLHAWFMRYPQLLLKTAKLIIQRSRTSGTRRRDLVANIAIVPLSPRLDIASFRGQLDRALQACGTALMLDPALVDRQLAEPGIALVGKHDPARYRALSAWLDTQEARHDFVVYFANPGNDAWTQRCLRQADRVVLLADATGDKLPPLYERALMSAGAGAIHADTLLMLWHPADTVLPRGTAHWLEARPWVSEVIHLRRNNERHMGRLARLLTGQAIGLVLGSGGARGLAAVGIVRALEEAGIPIDRVGGTSIGAIMAAAVALDEPAAELGRKVRHSFRQNPTRFQDLNLLPVLSIFQGKRLHGLLQAVFPDTVQIEDLWLNFFCISSDMASNREVAHTRGSLWRAVCASAALPGVFPMVRLGDGLHVDGAFMNALPVDWMERFGAHRILAADFSYLPRFTLDFADTPGPMAYLADKLLNGAHRRFQVPTLMAGIVQSSLLASSARIEQARASADVLFSPEVQKYDLLAWSYYDALVRIGYEHGRDVLAQSAAALQPATANRHQVNH